MPPTREDVQSLVFSLFTLTAGLDRARRERKGASTLSLLQVVDQQGAVRPTEIASVLQVHPSVVTRQLRELEDAGYTEVTGHPADGRAWLVTLTPSGREEMRRLQQVGWTASPCSRPTGNRARCRCSPPCWRSSKAPWPTSACVSDFRRVAGAGEGL